MDIIRSVIWKLIAATDGQSQNIALMF
jgi:hypothetical protein